LIVYPDTSFLVPLYLLDRHTGKAQQGMSLRPVVLFTPFHRAELTNAIYQRVFRREITADEARVAVTTFEEDCRNAILVLTNLPEMAFLTCAELARRRVAKLGVRTLDTLHVACALELKADRFWTFDDRQARLAEAEGLTTA
jgi:predicted nucleic acid-binding protein